MKSEIFLFLSIFAITISNCATSTNQNPEPFFKSFDKTKITFTDEGTGVPILLILGFINNGTAWNKTALKKKK